MRKVKMYDKDNNVYEVIEEDQIEHIKKIRFGGISRVTNRKVKRSWNGHEVLPSGMDDGDYCIILPFGRLINLYVNKMGK